MLPPPRVRRVLDIIALSPYLQGVMRHSYSSEPRHHRLTKASLATQERSAGHNADEWSEAKCLSVLTTPRLHRSAVEYIAWERLGYLRGYIDRPPID